MDFLNTSLYKKENETLKLQLKDLNKKVTLLNKKVTLDTKIQNLFKSNILSYENMDLINNLITETYQQISIINERINSNNNIITFYKKYQKVVTDKIKDDVKDTDCYSQGDIITDFSAYELREILKKYFVTVEYKKEEGVPTFIYDDVTLNADVIEKYYPNKNYISKSTKSMNFVSVYDKYKYIKPFQLTEGFKTFIFDKIISIIIDRKA